MPASPPPDIDVDAWHITIETVRARRPEQLAVTHFGVYADVDAHLERLDHELDVWASRVRDGLSEETFVQAARGDAADRTEDYDAIAPFATSWHGLRRSGARDGEFAWGEVARHRRQSRRQPAESLIQRGVSYSMDSIARACLSQFANSFGSMSLSSRSLTWAMTFPELSSRPDGSSIEAPCQKPNVMCFDAALR
jgi:hypothetical protein